MIAARSSGASRRTWICFAVCLVCAALLKPVQDRLESRLASNGPEPDLLFFSSPAMLRSMALGYDGLAADFYWMRVIQYYGRREEASKRPVRYKNLAALLDITTTLDPHLIDAYRAGSSFLAERDPIGAGQPEEAIRLLEKGIRHHPKEWRLLFDKGFIYYWYLNDFKAAGDVWLSASRLPETPHWMESLAAMSLSKGGAIETAMALWQRQFQESTRADIRENAGNYLVSIQVAKDLRRLEALVFKYRMKAGSFPRSLEEARGEKTGKYNLADPLGTPYDYNPETGTVSLSPETKVRYLQIPEDHLRLTIDD
jgi:tetratricopeptide (TPR) repeat protein